MTRPSSADGEEEENNFFSSFLTRAFGSWMEAMRSALPGGDWAIITIRVCAQCHTQSHWGLDVDHPSYKTITIVCVCVLWLVTGFVRPIKRMRDEWMRRKVNKDDIGKLERCRFGCINTGNWIEERKNKWMVPFRTTQYYADCWLRSHNRWLLPLLNSFLPYFQQQQQKQQRIPSLIHVEGRETRKKKLFPLFLL